MEMEAPFDGLLEMFIQSTNVLNPAHEHKMICGYQTMFDAFQVCGHLQVGSCKLPFIQVEIVVIKNT